ncbi:DNA repair protein RecN [Usitatibacter rugosus]|uniref:DNA repair protein RecN n=1 Tax=Usitatibacter rugosus TaxID=2732067 RepID=A0A6M4GU40_9PROT|nr:DNA repair protein RecN [Usitatibacter rugosus]QJR10542.1 DNA repair protein RecN [Usitatibacter rugosus]
MLRVLSIRDYVIVDRLEIELGPGFTTLTGETGAGKSILIDALALALGGRAEAGVVRTGAERAEVSAEFDLAAAPPAREWLAANDLDEGEGTCLLRRTVDLSGRSRAFVNGRPATVAQLRELGEYLLDIHGQHEHQLLLKRDQQRALVDAFGGSEALAKDVARRYGDWKRLADQRIARERAQETSAREREMLAHEIGELEGLSFDPVAFAEEEASHRRLAHGQELIDTVAACVEAVDESEGAATTTLSHAVTQLEEAARLDPQLEDALRDLQAASVHATEAAHQLRRYLQKLEVDPARLAQLDRRLRDVHDMARKYRVEPARIPDALADRRTRLAELGGSESLEKLREQEAAAEATYREAATSLSKARKEAARKLGGDVTKSMQRLSMDGGRLAVAIETLEEPSAGGLESIELQVSGHAGQPLAPLSKAASGGELSRLSLAIQVLLSGRASVPTLVFDEVDSGIGGGVAQIVGELLQALSSHHQVLCVTHLAQVASHARSQLRVSKRPGPRGTVAAVEALDAESRVDEIARMLGGLTLTEATRRHAAEMLQNARATGTPAAKGKGKALSRPS